MGKAPVSIVIFGITGDLARGKLIPALFDLYCRGDLKSDFKLIGYGRKSLSAENFSSLIFDALILRNPSQSNTILRKRQLFIHKCTYVQGELQDKEGYDRLRAVINEKTRALFFLSVHPELHGVIIKQLGNEKLLDKKCQVLIEKPFGSDVKSAKKLDRELLKFIDESQIYRLDHYLGKEPLIELIERRRHDPKFESAIEKDLKEVHVRLWEKKTVSKRGVFYDSVGALKDVGQNHLLQMVAAVISSRDIVSLKPEKVRLARAKAIDSLHIELPASRAQYNTYLEEPGVSPQSKTETFFSLSATVRSKKHAALKVLLSAGKGLSENGVDIRLVFKKPISLKEGVVNEVTFALNTNNFMEAYERVFLAAIERDLRYFCSLEESVVGWKFTDAVTSFWKKKQISLQHYDIGEDIYVPKKGRA